MSLKAQFLKYKLTGVFDGYKFVILKQPDSLILFDSSGNNINLINKCVENGRYVFTGISEPNCGEFYIPNKGNLTLDFDFHVNHSFEGTFHKSYFNNMFELGKIIEFDGKCWNMYYSSHNPLSSVFLLHLYLSDNVCSHAILTLSMTEGGIESLKIDKAVNFD